MSIVIGFSTTKSIISRVIRWFTKGKVSHAWVAFDSSELGIRLIMHATEGGYKLNQWGRWKTEGNIIVKAFKCSDDLSDGLKIMAAQLDEPYAYLKAIALGLKRWIGKLFRNPVQDKKRLECSEAVTLLLQTHGFAKDMDPPSTTPEDLMEYCQSNQSFIEITGEL